MLKFDVVIIGAGIAGLWTANRLQQSGLSVLVIENNHIGSDQTIHSQGIIHGGIKYSLTGKLSAATRAIADMPTVWQACLAGQGEIDLSTAKTLSEHYILWAAKTLGSKFGTLLASKVLQGQNRRIHNNAFPTVLQHPDFDGQVYQVAERVIDVASVLQALTTPLQGKIINVKSWHAEYADDQITTLNLQSDSGETTTIAAQRYIFTAGNGNQAICEQTAIADMQTRPLHMVYVQLDQDLPFYAHCIDLQQVPKITITTHYTDSGQCIWYLGGNLAETGIDRDPAQQCLEAKKTLQQLLPWLDMQNWKFSSFMINRAEQKQAKGSRPNSFTVSEQSNTLIAWPTKLAFAPGLAKTILQKCQLLRPTHGNATLDWKMPTIAKPFWEPS